MKDRIEMNGVEFMRVDSAPSGDRAVVVVDRGWIFAGDVTVADDFIILSRAVWVFRWERIGFNGVLENPKADCVDIRRLTTQVKIPVGAEVFRCPVVDDWGL